MSASHDLALDKLILALESEDLNVRIVALERLLATIQEVAAAAVRTLENPRDGRYLMAERIPSLGTLAVPSLEKLLTHPETEVRDLAAMDLLTIDPRNTKAIDLLRAELATVGGGACLSSGALSRANVQAAIPDILARLRKTAADEIDAVTCLVLALRRLGSDVPIQLREKFDIPSAPTQVRGLFRGSG